MSCLAAHAEVPQEVAHEFFPLIRFGIDKIYTPEVDLGLICFVELTSESILDNIGH